jgi:hypothetical protein
MRPNRPTKRNRRPRSDNPNAPQAKKPYEHEHVLTDTATCKKCGSENVIWNMSSKSGKWFLSEVFEDALGNKISRYIDFHSLYCGEPDIHEAEQKRLLNPVILEDYEDDDEG